MKKVKFNIHKEGYYFIGIFLSLTLIMIIYEKLHKYVTCIYTLFCVFFFRDPKRKKNRILKILLSPADGIVQKIERIKTWDFFGKNINKVSIFLNIFNVHINRIPISSEVNKLHYIKGKFFNVTFDKSSSLNERQIILLEMLNGEKIYLIQIAGLIARRIICNIILKKRVLLGEKFGIIKFGSKIDIYLSTKFEIKVKKGDRVVSRETIIAKYK